MKRRIIAVFAALAVSATALFGGATAATADSHLGSAYVAIGDSEAAGTGNRPYDDEACKRSTKAYPMLLASALGTPVESRACAGATTADVAGQAAGLAQTGTLGPATQLVTITAGVNNIAWQTVLALCSGAGTPAECEAAKNAAIAGIAGIAPAIGQLVGLVRSLAPNAYIVVTGYPQLFGDVTGTCTIGSTRGGPVVLPAQLVFEVNQGVLGINQAIQQGVLGYQAATGDPGVEYADVTQEFDGHGLCDTADRWIYGASAGEPNADRAFHATAAGQAAFAAAILTELSD